MTISLYRIQITILLFILVFVTSCDEEEITPDRDKFLGRYEVGETCKFGTNTAISWHRITIEASTTETDAVIITGLYRSENGIRAIVSGDQISFSEGIAGFSTVRDAIGSLSGKVLTMTFTVPEHGQTCTMEATKR